MSNTVRSSSLSPASQVIAQKTMITAELAPSPYQPIVWAVMHMRTAVNVGAGLVLGVVGNARSPSSKPRRLSGRQPTLSSYTNRAARFDSDLGQDPDRYRRKLHRRNTDCAVRRLNYNVLCSGLLLPTWLGTMSTTKGPTSRRGRHLPQANRYRRVPRKPSSVR